MCERTLQEQILEAWCDSTRLQQLIDQHLYVKTSPTEQPTKIYPLNNCEHSVEELRKAIDQWLLLSKQ